MQGGLRTLISAGADPKLRDDNSRSALSIAKDKNADDKTMSILEKREVAGASADGNAKAEAEEGGGAGVIIGIVVGVVAIPLVGCAAYRFLGVKKQRPSQANQPPAQQVPAANPFQAQPAAQPAAKAAPIIIMAPQQGKMQDEENPNNC
jgi:hypothetical protein